MNKRQKKIYESPTTNVVWLEMQTPLLETSGSIGGYGDADDNPWHFD